MRRMAIASGASGVNIGADQDGSRRLSVLAPRCPHCRRYAGDATSAAAPTRRLVNRTASTALAA
jgi:hypothetical protein